MAIKTEPTRHSPKSAKANNKSLMTIVVLVLLVVLGFVAFLLTRNDSLFRQDQTKLQAELKSIMDSTSLPGQLVYQNLQDDGCSTNYIGLANSTGCGYSGFKLYKNNKNLAEDLQAAKSWAASKAFKQFSGGRYHNGEAVGVRGEIELEFHAQAADMKDVDYQLKKLFDEGKIAPPTGDEYVYGYRIGASYFSCDNRSFFKQPCPQSPSEPKR